MTPYQLVAVGVRLLAVFVIVTVIWNIPFWLTNYGAQADDLLNGVFLVSSVLLLLVAGALWKFPMTISKGILGQVADPAEGRYEAREWFTVGCALIGVWLFAGALSAFLSNVGIAVTSEAAYGEHWELGLWLGYYLPQALIVLFLIFGAQGWTNLLWAIRNVGRPQSPIE